MTSRMGNVAGRTCESAMQKKVWRDLAKTRVFVSVDLVWVAPTGALVWLVGAVRRLGLGAR